MRHKMRVLKRFWSIKLEVSRERERESEREREREVFGKGKHRIVVAKVRYQL